MRPPTISGNGGADRYWRHAITHLRTVLCRNGTFLIQHGREWRKAKWYSVQDMLKDDPAWQPDTSIKARAAVTRTTRAARRMTNPTNNRG